MRETHESEVYFARPSTDNAFYVLFLGTHQEVLAFTWSHVVKYKWCHRHHTDGLIPLH